MVFVWLFWFMFPCYVSLRCKMKEWLFILWRSDWAYPRRTCKNTGVSTGKFREERVLWEPNSQVSGVVEGVPKVWVNCRVCYSSKVAEIIKTKVGNNNPPQGPDRQEKKLIKSTFYFCLFCSVYFWLSDLKFSLPKKSSSFFFNYYF